MVKSYEKKMSKFSYDGVVKCRRNLNFEKIVRLTQKKIMGFDEEYFRSTSDKILRQF